MTRDPAELREELQSRLAQTVFGTLVRRLAGTVSSAALVTFVLMTGRALASLTTGWGSWVICSLFYGLAILIAGHSMERSAITIERSIIARLVAVFQGDSTDLWGALASVSLVAIVAFGGTLALVRLVPPVLECGRATFWLRLTDETTGLVWAPSILLYVAICLTLLHAYVQLVAQVRGLHLRALRPAMQRHFVATQRKDDLSPRQTTLFGHHLSDLHVTEHNKHPVGGRPKVPTSAQVQERLEHYRADTAPPPLFLTGDITDTGSYAEWQRFLGFFPQGLPASMTLVPGNHDLNTLTTQFDNGDGELRLLRKASFLDMLRRRGGDWQCVRGNLAEHLKTVDFEKELEELLQSTTPWFMRGVLRDIVRDRPRLRWLLGARFPKLKIDDVWEDAFPHWRTENDGTVVIGLDSVSVSTWFLSNAFGRISDQSLKVLRERAVEFAAAGRIVVALHHHVCPVVVGVETNPLLAIENADELLDALCVLKRPVSIVHGHKHVAAELDVDFGGARFRVVSGGSTGFKGYFARLSFDGDGYLTSGVERSASR